MKKGAKGERGVRGGTGSRGGRGRKKNAVEKEKVEAFEKNNYKYFI